MSNLELCMYMSLVKRECVIPPLEFFFNLCGFLIFFLLFWVFCHHSTQLPVIFRVSLAPDKQALVCSKA